ncbi:MAG: WYL domain-containing protein [Treponema sp.]|nr:WYL domain-containing protein [Treponema sp.]
MEREEKVKTIRILEIDKIIRSGTYPNAKKLQEYFEVSRATINRDLEFLRDRYQAPIEYDFTRKGFYYSDETFVIQDVMLSESEIFSIFAITPLLEQYRNTPLESSIKSIFTKLVDFMPNTVSVDTVLLSDKISFIPEPKAQIDKNVFNTVFECIRRKKTLEFNYKGLKDSIGNIRRADPLHIVCRQGDWYMLAFCHKHEEVRMFSLARIESSEVTDFSFTVPEGFSPDQFFDPAFGIWTSDKKMMDVELVFDKSLKNYLLERTFHPSETKEEKEDGSVILRFRTNQFIQLVNWVLTFGNKVEVTNPPELIEAMEKASCDLYEMYKNKSKRK